MQALFDDALTGLRAGWGVPHSMQSSSGLGAGATIQKAGALGNPWGTREALGPRP